MKSPNNNIYANLKGEEKDWALFDLMEGNLSKKEEEALMQLIEKDPSLKNEFEELKLTKMPIEHIEFTNKSSLLKDEPTRIVMFSSWRKPLSIAASVAAILLISIPVYQQFINAPNGDASSSLVGITQEQEKHEEEQSHQAQNTQSELPITVAQTIPDQQHHNIEHHKEAYPKQIAVVNNVSNDPIKEDNLDTFPMEDVPVIARITPKNNEPIFTFASNSPVNSIPSTKALPVANNLEASRFNYSGLRGSLNQGLAMVAAPFRNTHIKIKNNKDKENPGLQIEVMTDQYYAVAMVNLRPRNSK
jgi:Tfp pilus assembly protein PilE